AAVPGRDALAVIGAKGGLAWGQHQTGLRSNGACTNYCSGTPVQSRCGSGLRNLFEGGVHVGGTQLPGIVEFSDDPLHERLVEGQCLLAVAEMVGEQGQRELRRAWPLIG